MNDKTLVTFWAGRARQAQGRIKRKPRKVRQTFIIFKRDLAPLKRKLGRRLARQLVVEDAHIMDIPGCTAGDWGGIPNM
jgi:hypothetical protein